MDAWVSGSGPAGAVFVSFGGTLAVPVTASRTVLKAVTALPEVRFVWKLSEGEQAAIGEELEVVNVSNLRIMSWVPQNDLLGHPKVKAFVTQVRLACH